MATERIVEIVESLQGTCKTLNDACQEVGIEEEDLTPDELQYLDLEIFLCEQCGWWCEICENHETKGGDGVCDDCFGDIEDEEE